MDIPIIMIKFRSYIKTKNLAVVFRVFVAIAFCLIDDAKFMGVAASAAQEEIKLNPD